MTEPEVSTVDAGWPPPPPPHQSRPVGEPAGAQAHSTSRQRTWARHVEREKAPAGSPHPPQTASLHGGVVWDRGDANTPAAAPRDRGDANTPAAAPTWRPAVAFQGVRSAEEVAPAGVVHDKKNRPWDKDRPGGGCRRRLAVRGCGPQQRGARDRTGSGGRPPSHHRVGTAGSMVAVPRADARERWRGGEEAGVVES